MINSKIKKILSKKNKSKIVCLTAYSKNMAEILDKHCDIILVGDSLGSVLYGMKSTKEVSLDMMINHTKSVKLEGGKKIIKIIKHLTKSKIAVMGHLGLLPQTQKGKFRYKGKSVIERKRIYEDSILLSTAGVFSIVLECVESNLSKMITNNIKIPTIGIGSSKYCDGQVLVTDDLIGLNTVKLRFVKKYLNLKKIINKSIINFKKDILKNKFPLKKHSF